MTKARLQASVPRDIVSPREYEQRQLALQKGESELAKAREVFDAKRRSHESERANLTLAIERTRREIERSRNALQTIFLRAPRDGIFVARDLPWEGRTLRVGDRVWVGFPLATMPELDSLQVIVFVPDVDDGRVRPGMSAFVTLDGYPRERFRGTVTGLSAVAQESGRNTQRRFFRAVVKLDRLDTDRMRPGLSARVEIIREEKPSALLAAREALTLDAHGARAALAGGGTVNVRVGSCSSRECVIESGLEEGDRLRHFVEGGDA